MDTYTAELYVIWHTFWRIHYLVVEKRRIFKVVIFSNSKKAIQSLQSSGQQYGQYLI